MAYSYDEIVSLLGEEAQQLPGKIIVYRDKHIIVCEYTDASEVTVTDEGSELLAGLSAPTTTKPRAKKVQSANVLASADMDLNLEV